MDATASRQSEVTKNVGTSGSVPGFPELIQTESGGNDKSFNSGPYFLVPTVPQPLNAFAKDSGAFDLAGYMDPSSLTGPVHPPNGTQSLHHAFMHGPRQDDPPVLLPTNSRVSDATSSSNGGVSLFPQQSTFLTEYPLPNETPSRSGLQESGTLSVIQSVARSEVETRDLLKNGEAFVVEGTTINYNLPVMSPPYTHVPVPAVDEPLILDQNEGLVGMPNWVVLIKPLPLAGENVINLRRDSNFALEIILAHLPMGSFEGRNGIKVPATASVKNFADTTGKTCLEFRIRLYGATTKELYEFVCKNCQDRMGKRRGTPSLIDFKAEYDVIEPKNGKIRIEFSHCCYPKCHKRGDTEYLLDIILSEDEGQNHIVAQCRLPFSFNILSKLPPGPRTSAIPGTRKRLWPEEDDGDPPAPEQRAIRRRMDDANIPAPNNHPGNGQIHDPAPDIGNQSAPRDHEGGSSSSLAISPPKIDRERPPTLTEVNPDSGSITGGVRIWLKGMDFPALLPLFARFGASIVPTTFSSPHLLACHLPPITIPGVINVTLSKYPRPNAPEYGTSIATFKYQEDHDELISILLRIKDQAYSPLLQAVLTALHDQGKLAPDPAINTLDPIQAQPGYQFASASGPTLGTVRGVGPPEQPHEGTGMFDMTPTWPLQTNITGPPTHRPQGFQFGATAAPSMNQVFNPSVPLNTAAQQYQWKPDNSFYIPRDNLITRPLSRPIPYSNNLTEQIQPNGQGSVPRNRTQLAGEGHGASAQPLITHGESMGIQSPYEDNRNITAMPPQWAPASQVTPEAHGDLPRFPLVGGRGSISTQALAYKTRASFTDNHSNQQQDNVLVNTPLVNPERPILAQTSPSTFSPVSVTPNMGASHTGSALYQSYLPPVPLSSTPNPISDFDGTTLPHFTGYTAPYDRQMKWPVMSPLIPSGAHTVARKMSKGGPAYAAMAPRNDLSDEEQREDPSFSSGRVLLGPFEPQASSYQHSEELPAYLGTRHAARLDTTELLRGQARAGSDPTTINIGAPAVEVHHHRPVFKLPEMPRTGNRVSLLSAPTTVRTLRGTTGGGGPEPTRKSRDTCTTINPEWSAFVAPLEYYSSPNPRSPTASDGTQGSRVLQRENTSTIQRDVPIETRLLEALRHLQRQYNFREIISTTNDRGHTLAHLSIFYGYASLLSALVDWRINLTIADVNGFTALHCAYMKGDLDSIRILRRGGASETVVDKLGRTPLDMQPEGFGSSVDNDAKVAAELVYPLGNDRIGGLTREFSALGLGGNTINI